VLKQMNFSVSQNKWQRFSCFSGINRNLLTFA
jgi:hypothetical protein